jgi:hypothetical protein
MSIFYFIIRFNGHFWRKFLAAKSWYKIYVEQDPDLVFPRGPNRMRSKIAWICTTDIVKTNLPQASDHDLGPFVTASHNNDNDNYVDVDSEEDSDDELARQPRVIGTGSM